MEINQLSNLVDLENPEKVFDEVKIIISMEIPDFDFQQLTQVFYDVVRLFQGNFPGYRNCNTNYHDLRHTTDTLLATTRLIHGYILKNKKFTNRNIELCLISVLMHDTGYIQTINDTYGTGAKYTLEHISRSILFIEKYFENNNFSKEDFIFCKNCISCTGLNTMVNDLDFLSYENEILGKMLGIADLLSQMADRAYLEKLLFLYYEFREGKVLGFDSEFDMLKKTLNFFTTTNERFKCSFNNLQRFMIYHFKERWNIDKDLYFEGIEKNIEYLTFIIDQHEKDYSGKLRRGNVVKKLYL
jgi:hypothetical protein